MTYATASDYAEYKGVPDDYDDEERARIDAGLLRAEDDINGAILWSRYDSTDTATQDALTRATCARFEFLESSGDDGSGAVGVYDSVAIGTVRLAKNAYASTSTARDQLAELLGLKAAAILRGAGFFSGVVYHR